MTTLHLDFETRSPVDLKKTGTYVYAEHPDTGIWCAAFALGDEPVRLWTPGQPCPDDVRQHIEGGGIVMAHNAAFERVIWHHIFTPRHGWPEPRLEQWRCTMAAAMALSLPAGLDDLAGALGLDEKKDDHGYRRMLQMARPRKRETCVRCSGTGTIRVESIRHERPCPVCNGRGELLTWWDDADRLASLYAYCRQDVVVEREIEKKMLVLRHDEQRLWFLDQRINDRGVYVDVDLCESANAIADAMQARLDARMRKVTGNYVRACTNAKGLVEWLQAQGVATDSVDKETVERLLGRDDLADHVRDALELRQMGSKTSTAKADALLAGRSADGRAKGMMQFHAASTGRWGGRRFQPQNLKRPDEATDIPVAIDTIKTRNLDAMLMLYDDPMSIIGDCIRGMVVSAPGRVLRAADFSNIEGRVLAWLAGEQWKLDYFAAYDRGDAPDLYKVTAGKILDKDPAAITKPERQAVGKTAELALGYQGGVGAMMTMSKGKVPFHELLPLLASLNPEAHDKAQAAYEQRGKGQGLSRDGWVAAEIIKLSWREANGHIARFWPAVEDAAIEAIAERGKVVTCGRLAFRVAGSFLFMRLPSGRALAYPYPQLRDDETPWGKKIKKIEFMGVDGITKRWGKQETYGGKLVENATQAVARDLLAYSMLNLDAAGWPIVLHVHDEIVTETPADWGSTEELEGIMAQTPAWADGLPVAAAGWSEGRYQK